MRSKARKTGLNVGLMGICLLPSFALAQAPAEPYASSAPRVYVVGGVGVSVQEIDRDDDYYDYRYSRRRRDDATAFDIGLGLQITPRWGVELRQVWLGKAHLRSWSGDQKIDTRLISLVGTFTQPIGATRWSVFGRAGLARTDVSAQVDGGPGRSTNKTPLVLGVGVSYAFQRNLAVQVNYDYYGRVGRDAYDRPVLGGALGAGLRFYFN